MILNRRRSYDLHVTDLVKRDVIIGSFIYLATSLNYNYNCNYKYKYKYNYSYTPKK